MDRSGASDVTKDSAEQVIGDSLHRAKGYLRMTGLERDGRVRASLAHSHFSCLLCKDQTTRLQTWRHQPTSYDGKSETFSNGDAFVHRWRPCPHCNADRCP